MNLPQHFMDELRRRTSLSEVVASHVKLIKRSNRLVGLCPFHNEKTPSFHVRDDDGYYHCFGCGVSGDAISFLREKQGLGFMDAVRQLANQAGLDVPQSTPQDPEISQMRKKNMAILDDSARQFQSALMAGDNPAAAYLKKRGIDQAAIETFRLGFARKSGLSEALQRFGHTPEAIVDSGMMRISERDQSRYEMFRHRLMFPITDNRGQVIAFGGRALTDEQQPKYLNSAETPLFQKKHVLYGMALARVAVRQGLPLVVCEGYMDVIAIHQSGLAAAVAPLGTALTEEQIKLLWRIDHQPILCFDGDGAGKAAALKALIRSIPLLEPGKTLRLALLPTGIDPDDLIKTQGHEAFQGLLNTTISWLDGFWDGLAAGYRLDEPSQRAAFWQDIRGHLKQISNGHMRASIGDEVERRITAMRQAVREARRSGPVVFSRYSNTSRPPLVQDARSRVILALLIEHPLLGQHFYEQISLMQFDDEKMEKLRQTVINIISIHSDLDDDGLQHHLNEYGYENTSGLTLLKGMEGRMRFDPSSLDAEKARERLEEVIALETRHNVAKPKLKRQSSDMMGS
jgi:DNA primase